MNTTTTPPSLKKETFRCLFTIRDHLELLEQSEREGIEIHKDPHGIFGCACFDNTIDLNNFKAQLAFA